MLELSRTVRFCLNQDGSASLDAPPDNTFAAWPPMRGLGRYYELEVACRGEADAVTGYFMNIKEIDRAVRAAALPLISRQAQSPTPAKIGRLMRELLSAINPQLKNSVTGVELRLTPTYRIRTEARDMDHVFISQQYEFSAAHRLHAPGLSPEENAEVFGKCNNPAGHGHNYRLEVTVRCLPDSAGDLSPADRLDAIVNGAVIEKLDHKNLDVDVPLFRGLNTSVENIARVVHAMLKEELNRPPLELDQVRVWETGKTVCTYRG